MLERLHLMTVRFLRDHSIVALMEDALTGVMAVTASALGHVQLVDPSTGPSPSSRSRDSPSTFFAASLASSRLTCPIVSPVESDRRVTMPDVDSEPDARRNSNRHERGRPRPHFHPRSDRRRAGRRALVIVDRYAQLVASLLAGTSCDARRRSATSLT